MTPDIGVWHRATPLRYLRYLRWGTLFTLGARLRNPAGGVVSAGAGTLFTLNMLFTLGTLTLFTLFTLGLRWGP